MTRITLNGLGTPIPQEALPDPNISGDLPPQRLVLNATDGFDKRDYVGLGYTHFEVWCIGAAGGKGGSDYATIWWHDYRVNVGGTVVTHYYLNEENALSRFYGSESQLLVPLAMGGGGGGGGLHRVSGLLSDLPDISPVVIGQAGADGPKGFLGISSPTVILPPFTHPFVNPEVYDNPHLTFYPPRVGSDGGASIFNDGTCQASGGKGGGVSAVGVLFAFHGDTTAIDGHNNPLENNMAHPQLYEIANFSGWRGNGGEGGIGNRSAAGGGAPGSTTTLSGSDGTWDGDVGSGGGGGRGGVHDSEPNYPMGGISTFIRASSSGGQGSYSFADTTVYGSRESRSGYNMPGGGGGAKVGSLQYGSHAQGYDPNGAVIIRLTKIT